MLYYVTAFKDYLNTYHRCNLKKKKTYPWQVDGRGISNWLQNGNSIKLFFYSYGS